MKGNFIVIEGLEGAGKTTARNTVMTELNHYGITDIVLTREPGGTPLAENLRELLKQTGQRETITAKTELLLMYAARSQLVENIIKPALQRGAWVIGDRHDLSSEAYQGGGRGIDREQLLLLKQLVLEDFSADLTLYLDIPPALGLNRVRQRGDLDRIEQEPLDFFQRTRQRYLQLAQADHRIITIDASQTLPEVTAKIQQVIRTWLQQQQIRQ